MTGFDGAVAQRSANGLLDTSSIPGHVFKDPVGRNPLLC